MSFTNYLNNNKPAVFISSLPDYAEGRLTGDWIQLPATDEQLTTLIKSLRGTVFITDYENMPFSINQYTDPRKLNQFFVDQAPALLVWSKLNYLQSTEAVVDKSQRTPTREPNPFIAFDHLKDLLLEDIAESFREFDEITDFAYNVTGAGLAGTGSMALLTADTVNEFLDHTERHGELVMPYYDNLSDITVDIHNLVDYQNHVWTDVVINYEAHAEYLQYRHVADFMTLTAEALQTMFND